MSFSLRITGSLQFLTLLCWSWASFAQVGSPALKVVPWHVRMEPEVVRPGGKVRLVLQAGLNETGDGPWKMYALGSPPPSRAAHVTLDALGEGIRQSGEVKQWDARDGFDPWFDTTVVYFEHQALLWVDLAVHAKAEEGKREVRGNIAFMVCNDRICLPPATRPFSTAFTVRRDAHRVLPGSRPKFLPDPNSGGGFGLQP